MKWLIDAEVTHTAWREVEAADKASAVAAAQSAWGRWQLDDVVDVNVERLIPLDTYIANGENWESDEGWERP